MRLAPFVIIFLVLTVACARAEETSTCAPALKEEALRLGNEALEVVKTPVDIKGYGFIGTLAVAGAVGLTYVFDNDIRNKVQGSKSDALDTATDVGDIVGNPLVHIGIAGAVFGGGIVADSPKWRDMGLMLGEAAVLADATSFILKQAIGRSRPFVSGDKGKFRPFQFKDDYDSMPSLQTASSFAMASVMASTSESLLAKAFYYSVATFVGFSRMYKDKHWASDALFGAAVGELCGRVVTTYHASHGKVALVPAVSGEGATLALVGSW